MTERERFRRLFRGEPVDRPPRLEDGIREGVAELWRRQGMPAGTTHIEAFGLAAHDRIGPEITPRPQYKGRILSLSARGYRAAFDASPGRFPKDWGETVERARTSDTVVGIWASRGFFQALGVGDWPTLEAVLYAAHDSPRKVRSRLEMYGDFCARMLEMTLRDVEPDFIYLGEPVSNNVGPLISPDMFRRFAIPVYEKLIAVGRGARVENFLVSTYGNTSILFPMLIEAGVNILWASEISDIPDMDYQALRDRYGPRLGLIGGIPLRLLAAEREDDMERGMREIVPPLLRTGRYIPLASGRVREDVSWARYKLYRNVLARIVEETDG